jgi:hypothetical protein
MNVRAPDLSFKFGMQARSGTDSETTAGMAGETGRGCPLQTEEKSGRFLALAQVYGRFFLLTGQIDSRSVISEMNRSHLPKSKMEMASKKPSGGPGI